MADNKIVLITGGTGLVGSVLIPELEKRGYEVRILTRSPKAENHFKWDYENGEIDIKAFENLTSIIHLAGASVAGKRWSASYKKEMYDSRVKGTSFLAEKLKEQKVNIHSIVCASAIGYYGMSKHQVFDEDSAFGDDYLATLTKDWELAQDRLAESTRRLAKLRIGIVLHPSEGALPQLVKPIKMGGGADVGSGKQQLSWIHYKDLVSLFIVAMEHRNYTGVLNAVTDRVSVHDFNRLAAMKLKRKIFLPPVPGFVIKFILGEFGKYALGSTAVENMRLKELGFRYKFKKIETALDDLL